MRMGGEDKSAKIAAGADCPMCDLAAHHLALVRSDSAEMIAEAEDQRDRATANAELSREAERFWIARAKTWEMRFFEAVVVIGCLLAKLCFDAGLVGK